MIRAVVLDIDGTLLGADKTMHPRTAAAVTTAAQRGISCALASGRMTACMEPLYDTLRIDGPVMSYNGAMVRASRHDGRRMLLHRPLDPAVLDLLIDFARERTLQLNIYIDDVLYAQDEPWCAPFRQIYMERTGATYRLGDLCRFRGASSSKAILIVPPDVRERLHAYFAARLDGRAALIRTDPEYLEFVAPGVSKGTALGALASALGVDVESIAAVGDGDNDIDMLRRVGLGVAVANAKPAVKEAADRVTLATSCQGAVAEAIAMVHACNT